MIVDEVQEIVSFKQNKWLEKFTSFNEEKRNASIKEIEKGFKKRLNIAFHCKPIENLWNRLEIKPNQKIMLKNY